MDRLKRPKTVEKRVECFTAEEQKQIEQAVMSDRRMKMRGIVLCLYTGLRIGELLALEWADVDLKKGELSVTKSCHDGKDAAGGYCRLTEPPKTLSSLRMIPIPHTLSELLGHRSPTITLNRYVHSLMSHKRDMMNRLGRLF